MDQFAGTWHHSPASLLGRHCFLGTQVLGLLKPLPIQKLRASGGVQMNLDALNSSR